jgi:hypothetical protein
MPAAPPLIGKRIGRIGLAITLHVKGVLPIDAQMPAARAFYISLGFEVLGPASNYALGKTMGDPDIVLRRILASS